MGASPAPPLDPPLDSDKDSGGGGGEGLSKDLCCSECHKVVEFFETQRNFEIVKHFVTIYRQVSKCVVLSGTISRAVDAVWLKSRKEILLHLWVCQIQPGYYPFHKRKLSGLVDYPFCNVIFVVVHFEKKKPFKIL